MDLIWYLPDGKGGQYRINKNSGRRVRKPTPYIPWRKEWQFPGALTGHAIWSQIWYEQEIARLKAKIKKLELQTVPVPNRRKNKS